MAEQCTVRSPGGVVAAAAPVAARVGADALAAGGNAIDAAIAAALAETVLLPPKCGLAGDLVALVWRPGADEPMALLAIGGAPAGLAAVAERGELAATGPMSVGVPGAPAGYRLLAEASRLDLRTLAQPAIALAREGFAWAPICTELAAESQDLVVANGGGDTVYFPEGRPIAPGALVRLPGLGRLLESFAGDPTGFLSGDVGRAIVARVRQAGGILTEADLQRYSRAEWVAPSRAIGRSIGIGRRYWATPAPTHGPSLLDAVGRVDPGRYDQGDVYRGVLGAIGRRRTELRDPSGTSMVSAIDRDRTMVTLVHSNSFPRFGSGLIVDEFDLILANRAGRGFASDPSHENFPAPGRRPATTLHAWAVGLAGGGRLQGATPGGANQMPWNAQTLTRLAAGRASPPEAVVAPRWAWRPDDDGVQAEDGFSGADLAALHEAAPSVERVARWGLRSAMQILADPGPNAALTATVDPRTGGAVIGR